LGFFSSLLDIINNKSNVKGIDSSPVDLSDIKSPTDKKRDNFKESRHSQKRRRKKYFSSASLTKEEEKWMNEYMTNIHKNEKVIAEDNISKGKMWIGMTRKQLVLMKGNPEKKVETMSRNNKIEEYYYDKFKDENGYISYKIKVVLIWGKVEKWYLY